MMNGLYFLETHECEYSQQVVTNTSTILKKHSLDNHINHVQLWHLKLGHINKIQSSTWVDFRFRY